MTKFSVLMSVYAMETPAHFRLAVDSVLQQTLVPSEIVLVKDGPLTECLEDTIAEFTNNRLDLFKIFALPENVGLGNALRFGLEKCAHEIVLRMDTDDICYPDRFEKQIEFLETHSDISIVGAAIQEFEENPGDLDRFRKLPSEFSDLQKFAKYRNPLNHPTVAFRKADIIQVGSYEEVPLFEDYYLWARVITKGFKIHNLERPLLHFRVGNGMIGRRHGFSYCRKEYNFLKGLKNIGFLSTWEFLISLALKLPLRLLPKQLLLILYKTVLR